MIQAKRNCETRDTIYFMRILGIDPGIGRMGWAVIEQQKSNIKAIAFDCFETQSSEEMHKRLTGIYAMLTSVIETHQPEVLAVEDIFFNTNAKTALLVGQARGVVLLAGGTHNLEIASYTPLQVKVAITGYGRAEKKQIGQMVKILLKLSAIPRLDDTTDALAVALTHAFSHKVNTLKK